ncbi:hypothetical protein A7U60_g5584 [Sanghuangporus baumii]|uniref:Transmembrane protein n=1 Tax=Sanghuangporus baumii TaxID=108892 RepID=A0A9Q5N398_SANBA|nr:hypothetical protein A7U60_g5584 [Sanghuangporus baumii]
MSSLGDTADPSVPLLARDENQLAQGQRAAHLSHAPVTRGLDDPPVYQHPLFGNDNKESYLAISPAQVLQSPGIADPRLIHAASASGEAEWYEALRELQVNIADLKIARGRASRYSKLSRFICGFCSENVGDSQCGVRVLEELVLAGMQRLSRIHSDPLVQAEWDSRAEVFSRSLRVLNGGADAEGSIALNDAEVVVTAGSEGARGQRFRHRAARLLAPSEKDTIMMGITRGFAILLCTPVIFAGAAVFSVGAMLYGSGKIIIGLGHVATCGKLH